MTPPPEGWPDDLVQPFQIDPFALRGRLVRLGPALDRILTRHDYPDRVAVLLGEAITLAVVLAGALKYDGVFTLQTKGDGAIRLMVADVSTAGAVRGYAQYDAAKLALFPPDAGASVPDLLGAGHIAFTVDQGEHSDRYQGIVELCGNTLAECAGHYFRQSEQLQAGIKLAVDRVGESRTWRGGGLMLQRVPPEGGYGPIADDVEDEWRRAMVLMRLGDASGADRPAAAAAPALVPSLPSGWGAGLQHLCARSALPLLARADRDDPARLPARRARRNAQRTRRHRDLRILQPTLRFQRGRFRPAASGMSA